MRSYIKAVSGAGVGIGTLALIFALFGIGSAFLDRSPSDGLVSIYVLACGLTCVTLSGIAWTLAEIANKVEETAHTYTLRSGPSYTPNL